MDILNSDWLISMLKKAGKTPQARLLSLFDILNDWTDAPGIKPHIKPHSPNQADLLKHYLCDEATQAGAAMPEMLANQLYFMALSAMQEKLLGSRKDGMLHAKSAAQALITAQTKKEFRIAKSSAYAIAAGLIIAVTLTGNLLLNRDNETNAKPRLTALEPLNTLTQNMPQQIASAEDTAALIAEIDQMRKGSCQLIEAIQLPDSYKKVYFENIVLGQISTNPTDQKLVRELLQKVRCNYTPMLMANSIG